MAGKKIGVLALQGAFEKHQQMLHSMGIESLQVRHPSELFLIDGLILPGGESTVMQKQIKANQLEESLKKFARKRPIFGTCAGMILMSKGGILDCLDIAIKRNGYGRQIASFSTQLQFKTKKIDAIFIRAPQITEINSIDVEVLAKNKEEPVLIRQGQYLAASFHPELTNDPTIHQYFIEMVY